MSSSKDYRSLLLRRVSGLQANTLAARQALYERMRHALTNQLNSQNPKPTNSEIQNEHVALETAIRRIESENRNAAGAAPEESHHSAMASSDRRWAVTVTVCIFLFIAGTALGAIGHAMFIKEWLPDSRVLIGIAKSTSKNELTRELAGELIGDAIKNIVAVALVPSGQVGGPEFARLVAEGLVTGGCFRTQQPGVPSLERCDTRLTAKSQRYVPSRDQDVVRVNSLFDTWQLHCNCQRNLLIVSNFKFATVTGIASVNDNVKHVEYRVEVELTPVGTALTLNPPEIAVKLRTAVVQKYDDGWRVAVQLSGAR